MSAKKKDKLLTKKERQRAKKLENLKWTIFVIVVGLICVVMAIAYIKIRGKITDEMNEAGSIETYKNDILNSGKLYLIGTYEDVSMHARLENKSGAIASMLEEGTFDPTVYLKAGSEKVMSFYQSKEMTEELKCKVYEFKDSNGKVLGYVAQDRDDSSNTVLDANLQSMGYIIQQYGEWVSDEDGNTIGKCRYRFTNTGDKYYSIDASFTESSLPLFARCYILYLQYNVGYGKSGD